MEAHQHHVDAGIDSGFRQLWGEKVGIVRAWQDAYDGIVREEEKKEEYQNEGGRLRRRTKDKRWMLANISIRYNIKDNCHIRIIELI
eukprot:scaffold21161_cov96-Cyclotella_meneghiniana.AAC.1